jgi:hypothetical protein
MTTNVTTDKATVTCYNAANTNIKDSKSVEVSNSKGAGTYIFSCGNGGTYTSSQFDAVYINVSSAYQGSYTSGSTYSDYVDWSINSRSGAWLSSSKDPGGEYVYISAAANTSTSPRTATVTLLQNTSNKACSFTVTQEGAA